MKAPRTASKGVALAAVVSVLLVACAILMRAGVTVEGHAAGSRAADADPARSGKRPNFLLIVTDDQQHRDFGGYDSMAILRERFLPVAVDFSLGFASNPACCPMRASLLTGGYPRRHGTEAVGPPLGGASKFRRDGADRETIACWLERAGYATGLFGKYMNFYLGEERSAGSAAPNTFYVPPCWSRWRAMASPEQYGGVYGRDYEIVAWDSAAPTPPCRDHCPPGGRRCANYPTRPCSSDADCRRYGRKEARCVGPGQTMQDETIACCGACSGAAEQACNDDAMCPAGERCVLGCRPTQVHRGASLDPRVEPGVGDDAAYATDVLAEWVREFVAEAVTAGKPFFAVYAPPAPHAGRGQIADSAARHHGQPKDVPPWRPPSYAEADVADKPRFVAERNSTQVVRTANDVTREAAFSALLAVDQQLGLLIDHLQRLGVYEDTVIAYVSDNGVCYGEHRQFLMTKEVPYECAIRVPIALSYPRRAHGTARRVEDKIATLADIPVTFADLAEVRIPIATDGASLAGWITGEPPRSWRREVLLEHWAQSRVDCVRYSGNVRDGDRIQLRYGDRYGRDPWSSLVFEWDADGVIAPGSAGVPLAPSADASFAGLQRALMRRLPGTTALLDPRRKILTIAHRTDPQRDAYSFWEEVDRGGAFTPCHPVPDFYGVRDERGLKYIEYNDGERELYDLRSDPDELRNVYGDPSYAAIQGELGRRLDGILRRVPKRADRDGEAQK